MNLTSSQPKQKEIYERVGYLTILFRDMQPEMGNKMENRFFESGTQEFCRLPNIGARGTQCKCKSVIFHHSM